MQKKQSLTHTITLILALIASANAGFKVFSEGKVELFNGIKLDPGAADKYPELGSNPYRSHKIQGTFRHSFKDAKNKERITFQVIYRTANDKKGTENALFLELEAPFNLTSDYQGKELVYSSEHKDPKYTLKNEDAKLFNLEKSFYIGKGEEVKFPVKFKFLEITASVEKRQSDLSDHDIPANVTTYGVEVTKFKALLQIGSNLDQIEIPMDGSTEEKWGSWLRIFGVFLLGGFVILIVDILIAKQTLDLESSQLIGTYTTGAFFLMFSLLSLKFSSGFWSFLGAVIVILVLGAVHLLGAISVILDKIDGSDGQLKPKPKIILLVAFLLNLAWFSLLIFKFELILKLFYFNAIILVGDLAAGVWTSTKYKGGAQFFFTLCSCLNLFLDQLFVYLIYAVLFYGSHGEYPELFSSHILKDIFIIFGVISLSIVVEAGLLFWEKVVMKGKDKGPKKAKKKEIPVFGVVDGERGEGAPRMKTLEKEGAKGEENKVDLGGNDIHFDDDEGGEGADFDKL